MAQIQQATQACFDQAQSGLRATLREREQIEKALSELDAQRRAVFSATEQAAEPLSQAALLWLRWADDQRAALNIRLARAMADENIARQETLRAFGRQQALDAILDRAR